MFKLVLLKVHSARVPSVVMAVMHTTMMRASRTAYSTAVGPSSSLMNRTTAPQKRVIGFPFTLHGAQTRRVVADANRLDFS